MTTILYRLFLTVSLLASASCATLFPFDYYVLRDGPISIGPEWTEVHCPDVVVTKLPQKELWLLLPQPLDVPNFHDRVAVFREDGKQVEIYAEIVDVEGTVYPLPVWKQRSAILARPRAGTYIPLTNADLPRTVRLTTIRLRSSVPITLSELLWIAKRDPGPPTNTPKNLAGGY